MQTLAPDTYLYLGIPGAVLLVSDDEENEDVEHLLVMPIEGGTVEELVTIENLELQDVAANDTHVFLAIGQSHAGGMLQVER